MGALTADVPKPLLTVGASTLIERHVTRLVARGIVDIVVNLSYRGAQIKAALGDGSRYGARIAYSEEGEPPLETAGGIVHALPLLGNAPFLLVNADVLTDFDAAALAAAAASTLVLVPNPPHNARGDFGLADSGHVSQHAPLLTYSGIAKLAPELFAGLAPGRRPLKPVLDAAIERRLLRGVRYTGRWFDVGTPERLAAARALDWDG